jgi:hypothetical protein
MNRREFLWQGAGTLVSLGIGATPDSTQIAENSPKFRTANVRWQGAYDAALSVLANNIRVLPRFSRPVLIEGSSYRGIWMECGPHESLVYRKFRPDVARNSHMAFFELQHTDGQLPANNKISEAGYGTNSNGGTDRRDSMGARAGDG